MTQLSATHITAGYQHEAILRELTLALPEGQLSVLIGSNGCGKSTLLKIALGVIESDAGNTEWGYETYPGYFSQDHEALRWGENDTVGIDIVVRDIGFAIPDHRGRMDLPIAHIRAGGDADGVARGRRPRGA